MAQAKADRVRAHHQGGDRRGAHHPWRAVRRLAGHRHRGAARRSRDAAGRPAAAGQDAVRDAARRQGARDAPPRPADGDPADARHHAAPDPSPAGSERGPRRAQPPPPRPPASSTSAALSVPRRWRVVERHSQRRLAVLAPSPRVTVTVTVTRRDIYSARSDRAGSIRDARHAGTSARRRAGGEQHAERHGQRDRIGRPHLEQQPGHPAQGDQRRHRAHRRAGDHRAQPVHEHHPPDRFGPRPQRQADADLEPPLRHRHAQRPVQPDHRQQQRQRREDAQGTGHEATRALVVGDDVGVARDVGHRLRRIDVAHHAAHGAGQRRAARRSCAPPASSASRPTTHCACGT